MVADRIGFYIEDEFILEAKARIVANSHFKNGQKHARKYTSTFWVFKKDERLAKNNSLFKWLKQCEEQDLEGKIWIEPKEAKRLEREEEIKHQRGRKSYRLEQFSKTGEFIKEWNSPDDVVNKLGISKASLSQCVNGKIKTSGGFIWKKAIR